MRYAIGDIHGCVKTLEKLVHKILREDKNPQFFSVGDLIDRGPDARAVIDLLWDLNNEYPVQIVRGNHEEMMLNTLFQGKENWFFNGAEKTLQSFAQSLNHQETDPRKVIPQKYIEFFQSLPYFIELDDYLIVHAGFNFTANNPFEDTESMVWIRTEENDPEFTKNKKIIHGHTPVPFQQIKMNIQNSTSRIYNIDSGCVYLKFNDLGILTALNMDTLELIAAKNVDL
ncbi:MAG: metallophosphoesterase family protein [Bacteroidales bacterium]|jgi:serine/threonine protein phosphatase 1|nr:metallophosphoesterase family protein [Bacteroidales bacterium]